MGLLDDLGIDPEDFEWQDLALCQGMPTNWFYDDYESSTTIAQQVDEACLRCPVLRECGRDGREHKENGVWGAIYWNGSGKPDKGKNAHKTPEVWTQIKDRLTND